MQKELNAREGVLVSCRFALQGHSEAVLLAGVVAFIVLCTLTSVIIKEIFRRRSLRHSRDPIDRSIIHR